MIFSRYRVNAPMHRDDLVSRSTTMPPPRGLRTENGWSALQKSVIWREAQIGKSKLRTLPKGTK